MLSFHRCIISTSESSADTYLNNLDLREVQRNRLVETRRLVRDALRAAFKVATAAFADDERPISPKFFTQGSWSYKTINRPTHLPPQQADMDDGCYLPMLFVRGASPKRAATWFFDVADRALRDLVAQQGWAAYDNSKPMCCRVVIDSENHIDVPLYAIRDDQFKIMKSIQEARAGRMLETSTGADYEYLFDWSMIAEEDVVIAKRNGTWTPSNPMVVSNWVETAVKAHGAQLRDIWRSAKGWRDQQFREGGPSSICLMVMIEADFHEISRRHDLALLEAAKSIRRQVLGDVVAPWDDREQLNRLSSAERQAAASKAEALEKELSACILGDQAAIPAYLQRLQAQMGRHFSLDATRVEQVRPPEIIRSYAPSAAAIPNFRGDNRSA
jgi:hypothetical protein